MKYELISIFISTGIFAILYLSEFMSFSPCFILAIASYIASSLFFYKNKNDELEKKQKQKEQ